MLDPITKLLTDRSALAGDSSSTRPIVLMYHGTPLKKPSSIYSIKADRLKKHLVYLERNGWNTILFSELLSASSFPPKTIALTFDDGYADNYRGAFLPILDHGMKATWFITTDCIGRHAHWMGEHRKETEMLNKEQLIEMAANGMEIGSHTCSHPDLSSLDYDRQVGEMKASKEQLETLLQNQVTGLAYPFGKSNLKSHKAARSTGYNIACTTSSGSLQPDADPMLVPRVTMFRSDSVSNLARKLIFADNEVPLEKIAAYYLKRVKYRLLLI